MLKRPARACDLVAFETLFDWPPDWAHVKNALIRGKDTASLRRLLWFLGGNGREIPADVVQQIIPLWRHDDSLVRACAIKIILDAGTEDHVREVVDEGWAAGDSDHNYVENHWGSWLLIDRAKWLSLNELRARIPDSYHADALEVRGEEDSDFIAYAKWLDRALKPHASLPITVELQRDEQRDSTPTRSGSRPHS